MKKIVFSMLAALCLASAQAAPVVDYLQNVSLTVRAAGGSGSGVLITKGDTAYVLTAAHVVDSNRKTRTIVDPEKGGTRIEVWFTPVLAVKVLVEEGTTIGRSESLADVIRYSDPEYGEDLALLKIRKKNFVDIAARFYTEQEIPELGTDLIHVGSLLGEFGHNSVTTGVYSQKGRLLFDRVFDQTTCAAFPGSSGGGVFLRDGRYVGMIVRGAGETYNLIVPMRRIKTWAERCGVMFIYDGNATIDESKPIEDPKGATTHRPGAEDGAGQE